jgi:hypothetical protein
MVWKLKHICKLRDKECMFLRVQARLRDEIHKTQDTMNSLYLSFLQIMFARLYKYSQMIKPIIIDEGIVLQRGSKIKNTKKN